MEKIGRVKDLKRGESTNFQYQGKEGILVKTKKGKLVAYNRVCPLKLKIDDKKEVYAV